MRTLPRKIESCNGMFLQVQVYSTDSSSPVDNSGVEHLHLNKQILVAARSQFEAAEADGIYWRGRSAQEMNPEPSFWCDIFEKQTRSTQAIAPFTQHPNTFRSSAFSITT